jgi:hypothetical protein
MIFDGKQEEIVLIQFIKNHTLVKLVYQLTPPYALPGGNAGALPVVIPDIATRTSDLTLWFPDASV